jgi:hypothetical protein
MLTCRTIPTRQGQETAELAILDYAKPRQRSSTPKIVGAIVGYVASLVLGILAGITMDLLGMHSSTKDMIGLSLLSACPVLMGVGAWIGYRFF